MDTRDKFERSLLFFLSLVWFFLSVGFRFKSNGNNPSLDISHRNIQF
jgi:hypothetical protein